MMQPLGNRRQVVLFLLAILAPCLVLVVLSVRMLVQEKELAEKRKVDQRRQALDSVRDRLLVRLERIAVDGVRNPAVVVAGHVAGRRLVLAWERDPASGPLHEPAFLRKVRQGEQQEFAGRRLQGAARSYEDALRTARNPAQAAYARFLRARTLETLGRRKEALADFRALLAGDPGHCDEEGVPLSFYAAERFLAEDPAAALAAARRPVEESRFLPPAAWFLAAGLFEKLPQDPVMGKLRAAIAQRTREAQQAEALQEDFPRLPGKKSTQPVWVLYGDPPWLVRTAPGPNIVGVRASEALAPSESERVHFLAGEPLGESFPGLRAALTIAEDEAGTMPGKLQIYFLYGSLVLVLGATMFGAHLLWLDLRRELRLSEMRGQFVASVSHELKTPLTAIRMFAETLQMGRSPDPETQSEYLDTIVGECERLSRLVDDVLHFSKVEQGKKMYQFRPVRLEEVVRAAARTLHYPLEQKGFQLHVRIEDGLEPVRGDRDALEQALLNLLSNAIKYSGDAREIELELVRNGTDAVVRVTDHGVGIAPEEHRKIFDKFYRAPTRENQLIPGTGLGLALVAHIAQAHGGRAEVESAPGQGSTFSLIIPMEKHT